jgi:hypothetical protein
MANSATSAAKRRRAGLSAPTFGNQPLTPPPPIQTQKPQPYNGPNVQNVPNGPNVQNGVNGQIGRPVGTQVLGENLHRMGLQQVISLLDNRILKVEKFVCDFDKMELPAKLSSLPLVAAEAPPVSSAVTTNTVSNVLDPSVLANVETIIQDTLNAHMDEFNHRYEILASEILNLKNIVMKLQSYTMDVNKVLMEERVRILSDITPPPTNNTWEKLDPENTIDCVEDSSIPITTDPVSSDTNDETNVENMVIVEIVTTSEPELVIEQEDVSSVLDPTMGSAAELSLSDAEERIRQLHLERRKALSAKLAGIQTTAEQELAENFGSAEVSELILEDPNGSNSNDNANE